MTAPDVAAIAAADQERAEYTTLLAEWIDEARRQTAEGTDPTLAVGLLVHGLLMAPPRRVAALAAVAIWKLAKRPVGANVATAEAAEPAPATCAETCCTAGLWREPEAHTCTQLPGHPGRHVSPHTAWAVSA